jgi:adenylosuccinate lyase
MEVWRQGGDLKDQLKGDERVTSLLAEKEIDSIFDLNYHLKYLDAIFERVFGARQA